MQTTISLDRQLINPRGGSVRHILLTLTAPSVSPRTEHAHGRVPLNLSLVLDRSGSMEGEKFELAKQAAVHTIRALTALDTLSLIAYDDEVLTVARQQPIRPEAQNTLIRALTEISPRGGTNLHAGWQWGCQQALGMVRANGIARVLLLSDGLANQGLTDRHLLGHQASLMAGRGVQTSTFGVGQTFDPLLMQDMAELGRGNYYYLRQSRDILASFEQEIADLAHIVASNLVVEVRTSKAVRIEVLNDWPCEIIPHGIRTFLGDMRAAAVRDVVLRVTCPEGQEDAQVDVRAVVMYTDAGTGRGMEIPFPFGALRYASGEIRCAEVGDFTPLKRAGLLYAARAKRRAVELSVGDNHAAGVQLLRRVAQKISAYAGSDSDLVQVVGELWELAKSLHDPHAVRESRYGSHLAQRSRADYRSQGL
jgi:Ca-activated chloride channel homolog